jgi:uncharacterized RDD family membrane protein YckC
MVIVIEETLASLAVQLVFSFVYTVGFWIAVGATPGKIMMGIRLEMVDGRPITMTAAVVRYFAYLLSVVTLLLGFLLIAISREKRGLHDFVAGTVAVTDGD